MGVTQHTVLRELLQLWRFLGTQPSIVWEISGIIQGCNRALKLQKFHQHGTKVTPLLVCSFVVISSFALRLQCIVGLNAKTLGQG
jgi:hypothetical protein